MYKIDFKKPIHMYFMGIGGISMSGFAELLHTKGFTVTGSDSKKSKITQHLESLGIRILYGQRSSNITSGIDLIVYTAAIKEDNEEYVAAQKSGIPMMDRAEMVGQVMTNYKNSIAISGTHGKTTTTSMLSNVFLAAELDPTISVGGILKSIDGNIRIGHSDHFITEACEYTNSFLKFNPKISVILNVEEDHLDFFKNIDDIRNSFQTFAKKLPDDGLLLLNGDIDNFDYFIKETKFKTITYSVNDHRCNYSALNIGYDEHGCGYYDLALDGEVTDHIKLSLIGLHNISNSLPVIAISRELNIPMETIKRGLLTFEGTDRRFEYKGEIGGITIIDDYAHHPTEIQATLNAAKKYPHKDIWCVFQPHTYTRTKAFLKDFAKTLALADKIVLSDIYAAREADPGDISSKDLLKELLDLGKEAYYFPCFDEIENFLLLNCNNGDLLITMGAGDIVTIGEALLGK